MCCCGLWQSPSPRAGRGHLTDRAVKAVFHDGPFSIEWRPEELLPMHPNGMRWYTLDADGKREHPWEVYSTGGGALEEDGERCTAGDIYEIQSMAGVMEWCRGKHVSLADYVFACEGSDMRDYLGSVWAVMRSALGEGLAVGGVLPGSLQVPRKGQDYLRRAKAMNADVRRVGTLSAYALAVSEVNASGGRYHAAYGSGHVSYL